MPGSMEEALFLLSVSRLGSLALLLGHLPALLPGHRLALLPGHVGALLLRHVVAVLLGHVVALLVADHCAGLAGNRLALLARHLGCELGQIRGATSRPLLHRLNTTWFQHHSNSALFVPHIQHSSH